MPPLRCSSNSNGVSFTNSFTKSFISVMPSARARSTSSGVRPALVCCRYSNALFASTAVAMPPPARIEMPPGLGIFSTMVTSAPESAAATAETPPANPKPTTTTSVSTFQRTGSPLS